MHRYHSELSSDEVWFRLNQLLMAFSAWGTERFQVSGELTAWGCYLWLHRTGNRPGTRVPLWLWTEGEEHGCAVCCRFAPQKGRLRSILVEPATIAAGLFLVCLEAGLPLPAALLPGLTVGAAFAGILALITWVLPRLASCRWERQLLGWTAGYLLPRDLENLLLPDLETQRENWAGLSADRESKFRLVFQSPLPPGDLPAALEEWQREESRRTGASIQIRWQEGQVTIRRRDLRTGKDAVPFRGRLKGDGSGGTVLRGGFPPSGLRLTLWTGTILLCMGLLASLIAAGTPRTEATLLLTYLIRGGIQSLLHTENQGSREILQFLRIYMTEIEG